MNALASKLKVDLPGALTVHPRPGTGDECNLAMKIESFFSVHTGSQFEQSTKRVEGGS
jgi:hypothetical protein